LTQKNYLKVTGIIFTIVALLHVLRLLSGWEVRIGDLEIPYWASVLGAVVAGFLAYSSQNLKK
jgi:hypothetical protein